MRFVNLALILFVGLLAFGCSNHDSDNIHASAGKSSAGETNSAPRWVIFPSHIRVDLNQHYSGTDGLAFDGDTPSGTEGDAGYLTCSARDSTCSFEVNVTGTGPSTVMCDISFTAPADDETCDVDVVVTDGYGKSVERTVTIFAKNLGREWTIMAYLNADTDIEEWVLKAFNFMEEAGSTPDIDIVGLVDRIPGYDETNGAWTTARLYHVDYDSDPEIINSTMLEELGEIDMGSPQVLEDFIVWAVTEYPARHYILLIWGHGLGYMGMSPDDTDNDHLTLPDMNAAFEGAMQRTWLNSIDILGLDACKMQRVENVYSYRRYFDYHVASENMFGVPGLAFPEWITALAHDPAMSAFEVAKSMVEAWWNRPFPYSWYRTLSVVDPGESEGVVMAMEALTRDLCQGRSLYRDQICDAIDASKIYYKDSFTYSLDLYHFAHQVAQGGFPDNVIEDAEGVMAAVDNAVVWNRARSGFVNGLLAHGLAIYYPADVSLRPQYHRMEFSDVTRWDELVSSLKCSE